MSHPPTCFYCDEPAVGGHEHDHFPIARRHGGREHTVVACRSCHNIKDRVAIYRWTPGEIDAGSDLTLTGRLLTEVCAATYFDPEGLDPWREMVNYIAPAVARVVAEQPPGYPRLLLAKSFNLAMDRVKEAQSRGSS